MIWERTGDSLDDAKALDAEKRVLRKKGLLVPGGDASFSQLTKWYLDLSRVRALSMFKVIDIHLGKFNAEFGGIRVDRLKKSALQNFQADLADKGLSASYIDQIIGSAKTMVNAAIDDDILPAHLIVPFRKTPKQLKKNANARDLIFTRGQYDAYMSVAPVHTRPIFATGYWTGMRFSEIVGLTRAQLFLKERLIRLSADDTKDDEPRVIPIFQPLYEILSSIPPALHTDRVFLYKGLPLVGIRDAFIKGMKAAGIPCGRKTPGGLTFHDLRHTFNTNARKAGIPDKLIMKITGHSTREMFDRYNTITADEIDLVEDKMIAAAGQFVRAITQVDNT